VSCVHVFVSVVASEYSVSSPVLSDCSVFVFSSCVCYNKMLKFSSGLWTTTWFATGYGINSLRDADLHIA